MGKKKCDLNGIITTVISPFIGDDKRLDLKSLENEIDMACNAGVSGFLVPCLASEQWLLSTEEKKQLVETTSKVAKGRAKLITTITAPTTEERIRLLNEFRKMGVDGMNMQVPHDTEEEFMEAIAAIDKEKPEFLIIQDADFTGDGIDISWLLNAYNTFDSVVGTKLEVKYTAPKCSRLIEKTNGEMVVASGWGNDQLLELLDRGVNMVMPSGMFELWTKVFNLHISGNREAAKKLFYDMLPIITFTRQSQELNRWFHKRYLKKFGAFESDISREEVVIDSVHISYADELIERAETLIANLDNYH